MFSHQLAEEGREFFSEAAADDGLERF